MATLNRRSLTCLCVVISFGGGCGRLSYEQRLTSDRDAETDAAVSDANTDAPVLDASLDGGADAGQADSGGSDGSSTDSAASDGGNAAPSVIEIYPGDFDVSSDAFVPVPGATFRLPVSPVDQPWVVWFSAAIGSSATGETSVEVRYTVDGEERGYGGTQNSVANRPGPFFHFVMVNTSAGEAEIALELRDVGGGISTIEQTRIVAFQMPPGTDFAYGEVNPATLIMEPEFTNVHQVAFAPSSPGDYVIFGAVAASEAPNLSDTNVRWRLPDGTTAPYNNVFLRNVRQPWQTFVTLQVVNVPSTATHAVALEVQSVETGSFRASHILVMRKDAFDDVFEHQEHIEVDVPSGSTQEVAGIATTASPGGRYG